MKKWIAIFLAMLILPGLFCGCKKATGGNTNAITVGIAQDLDNSLDPYKMTAAGTREVMFNIFEGLVKPDKDGNFVYAVAQSHEASADGLVYTFILRDDVVFHNGAKCTVDDVLYSFETCASTSVTAALVEALSACTFTAQGNQFVVTLASANPDFLSYVCNVSIVPKGYTDQATKPVGTGPFKFVSRSVQENFIIARHEQYYGTPARLEQVTYRIFEDNTALFTALDSGSLDLVAHLTADQVSNLSNGYTVLEGTMNLVQAVYLNHNVKPFDDVRVRQALCYGVDVKAMLELTADGHGTPVGSSMYPAFGKYFDQTLADAYPHDAAKAKELLAQAGYPDGFSFTIKVPSNYQPHVDTAVVIAQQLKAIGVTAHIQQVDWNTWLSDVYKGRNFEATITGFDSATLNASGMLARWESGNGKNMISYSNPDYDAAYQLARQTADDVLQTQYYKQCLEILSRDAANVYLQDLADYVAVNPKLKGYEFYPLYVMDMSLLYWEKSEWIMDNCGIPDSLPL